MICVVPDVSRLELDRRSMDTRFITAHRSVIYLRLRSHRLGVSREKLITAMNLFPACSSCPLANG